MPGGDGHGQNRVSLGTYPHAAEINEKGKYPSALSIVEKRRRFGAANKLTNCLMQDLTSNALTALRDGNQLVLEQLYVRYAESIFKRILVLVHDPTVAEELVNDIFLQLWQQRETVDAALPVDAVLLRKAKSVAIDHYRKSLRDSKLREQLMQQATAHHDPINDLVHYKELRAEVEAAIAKLPPQRQAIFRRCKLDGESYKAVAQEFGVTVGTVKDHMAKAMRILKAELKGTRPEVGLFLLIVDLLFEK